MVGRGGDPADDARLPKPAHARDDLVLGHTDLFGDGAERGGHQRQARLRGRHDAAVCFVECHAATRKRTKNSLSFGKRSTRSPVSL